MQKTKNIVMIGVVLGLAFSFFPGIPVNSTGGGVPSCSLGPQNGRIIVNFSSSIRSDRSESRATSGPVSASIPRSARPGAAGGVVTSVAVAVAVPVVFAI